MEDSTVRELLKKRESETPQGPRVIREKVVLEVRRGMGDVSRWERFEVEVDEGMVVLDAIHRIQATQAPDLACRWNCKAGKCGSCSAEINGRPSLMCMTRISDLPEGPIRVEPMKTFPRIKDLVVDVSWNYALQRKIPPFRPVPKTPEEERRGEFRMMAIDIERSQEFRKCIECFLCQDVCHVLRDHGKFEAFVGPRFLIHLAALEMHPKDSEDRIPLLAGEAGVGFCNITKCCTEVCPEGIRITDNAIIPLKERVADRRFDPLRAVLSRIVRGRV